ncbi:3-isopropylmalate dehydratase small subunit [Oenococcus alcoholitolerans]|uniref:3-isopropylmalate dehydratase small subunit n=1 Tax=Oenococcus alcoholitolerans TaxID=931074 RepID=UPI003F71A954
MKKFIKETGTIVSIPDDDIDTDTILPKQFLKNILKTGFGRNLFFDWRYLADGRPNPDFILNKPEHKDATILVTGKNFGSGSSREHAVWALTDYGFKSVIAGSFSDIFYMNATKNALLPIVLDDEKRSILRSLAADQKITIDLPAQKIYCLDHIFAFDINPRWKENFIKGQDDIDVTMKYADKIKEFEKNRPNFN